MHNYITYVLFSKLHKGDSRLNLNMDKKSNCVCNTELAMFCVKK